MQVNVGGDRLGSGNDMKVRMKNYYRSTHDLSYTWRSSMASGTLVPFMKIPGLPGDNFDIDLSCEVLTLPTIGPLFGSFKVQLDVFSVPIRLYQAQLHMNALGIGMKIDDARFPTVRLYADNAAVRGEEKYEDNFQVNASCLFKYLGISGLGRTSGADTSIYRDFSAIPMLAYFDIFKQYYANKMESTAYVLHTEDATLQEKVVDAYVTFRQGLTVIRRPIFDITQTINLEADDVTLYVEFGAPANRVEEDELIMFLDGVETPVSDIWDVFQFDELTGVLTGTELDASENGQKNMRIEPQTVPVKFPWEAAKPSLFPFDLENIDTMKERILQNPKGTTFQISKSSNEDLAPYNLFFQTVGEDSALNGNRKYSLSMNQEMLAVKAYQSDLFNNWIDTEWIDGDNGVNAITSVDTTGDSFTIDALNLAQKVYVMLNRIAISGGSYDDWLDAVYTHERTKSVENPVYMGSLIKELAFQEVVSNADTEANPLGTLAGRGKLTGKNKGGKIKIRVDEPSYIIGIASLTPRIDFSQGNDFDNSNFSLDDFHKPALDAIGFQDLITDQLAWQDTVIGGGNVTYSSAGKQPAWVNYMTAVNKTYGNFAERNKDMFMTLNRRYDVGENGIEDLTTYVDPDKFNFIFAQTDLAAQNFWVQIGVRNTARRKMSAKVIPNL